MLLSKVDCVFPLHSWLIWYLIASSPAWAPREIYLSCMIIISILVLVFICNAPGTHTHGGGDTTFTTLFAFLLTWMKMLSCVILQLGFNVQMLRGFLRYVFSLLFVYSFVTFLYKGS